MSSDYRIKQFEYPVVAGVVDDRSATGLWGASEESVRRSNPDEQVMREAQAREIGRHEGEAKARAQFEEMLKAEREKIAAALREFANERSKYFEQVEYEVVQLALAIARRVLRREANIDSDLLSGLVRYTLEKLRDGTRVTLRIRPADVTRWRMQFGENVEVVADPDLLEETCIIETDVGTTAVNVDAQLKEIESGLMDLLSHRPPAS